MNIKIIFSGQLKINLVIPNPYIIRIQVHNNSNNKCTPNFSILVCICCYYSGTRSKIFVYNETLEFVTG